MTRAAPRLGLELVSASGIPDKGLRKSADPSGAESGALGAEIGPIDARLAEVVRRWPTLPEAIRQGIAAPFKRCGPGAASGGDRRNG